MLETKKDSFRRVDDFFARALTAHLPPMLFEKLKNTCVLVAGVGGGGNIAELLVRKGIGRLIIADLDVFEAHNIRQRGSMSSTLGKEKVEVMAERLRDINPFLKLEAVREGITSENVESLVSRADIVVDMLDLHAPKEKVAMNRIAREQGKYVFTAPSAINGAVLWIFPPNGIHFEQFWNYEEGLSIEELALRLIKSVIPRFPEEAPEALYLAAARGERTIPLDAVGVDQASVMTVCAIENLVLNRMDRLVLVPKGLQVDLSNPSRFVEVVDSRGVLQEQSC